MAGPLPKDPSLRQRQNRSTTASVLVFESSVRRRVPPLPKHRDWHALTKAWWRDTWRSPMAPEFLHADIHGLYLLADLIDRYWVEPSISLAGEIRLQRQCFGLTPIDRRRLQWEVEKVETAARKRMPERAAITSAEDPRHLFRVMP